MKNTMSNNKIKEITSIIGYEVYFPTINTATSTKVLGDDLALLIKNAKT